MSAVSVPGYEVIDVLGRGGFGVVYRARQVTVDREVAVKVDSRLILDDRDQRRFLREVRAAGRLSGHPHVVEIYDAGVLPDARPYLVMELCAGGSLAERGRMSPREVAEIGQKIADALAAAHDLGVLHRDIKPGNILVKRYGTVGLADFGLAAVVEAGRDSSVTLAALTPAYAAPEAFHLHPPTVQSDVYALTATLYTLLAGYPPRFPASGELSVPEIVRRHDSPIEDIPGIAPQFMAILRRGLAKDPAHRYQEAAALRADLSQLTVGDHAGPRHAVTSPVTTVAGPRLSVPPHHPPPAHPSNPPSTGPVPLQAPTGPPRSTRRPLVVAGAALAAVVVLLAAVWYFVIRDDNGNVSGADPGTGGIAAGSGSASPSPTVDDTARYGVPTVTEGCPAAEVPDARARCTKRAQCWSGIVMIQGQLNSIRELPCEEGHVFETFAISVVPPEVVDPYQDLLAANPSVRKVCSQETMLASRFGEALDHSPDSWSIEILPPTPDDREQGRDIYRCVATLTSEEGVTGSAFRPR
ncbi:MAG: protein kinase [Actinophytocola sp.]|uniref:protein kinase domain-containing protein n=1 Tax=Actinophytocola sp. TaxID=1872138 RepID=UPI0013291F84|nr:protein kinase [Actinophytocola sp.]MPZ81474.1 protein kinase [Actinophytocola sp.]